jgi:hypothetical protein
MKKQIIYISSFLRNLTQSCPKAIRVWKRIWGKYLVQGKIERKGFKSYSIYEFTYFSLEKTYKITNGLL